MINEIQLKDPRFSDWLQVSDSKVKVECKVCCAIVVISGMGVSTLNSRAKRNKHKQIISSRNTDYCLE